MASLQPKPASRQNDCGEQWHAGQVLDALTRAGFPHDAYCMLAVTMCDLYPREEWNFVYGLARLTGRVGVFSFIRHEPIQGARPDSWPEGELLYRSTKTMLHEIGHMFGLRHCTWYNCLMRGSNGEYAEHQKNYLHLCPKCLRKLHWSIGFDIPVHYASLLDHFQAYEATNDGFKKDCEFLRNRLAALQDVPAGATAKASLAAASDKHVAGAPVDPRPHSQAAPHLPRIERGRGSASRRVASEAGRSLVKRIPGTTIVASTARSHDVA